MKDDVVLLRAIVPEQQGWEVVFFIEGTAELFHEPIIAWEIVVAEHDNYEGEKQITRGVIPITADTVCSDYNNLHAFKRPDGKYLFRFDRTLSTAAEALDYFVEQARKMKEIKEKWKQKKAQDNHQRRR